MMGDEGEAMYGSTEQHGKRPPLPTQGRTKSTREKGAPPKTRAIL
jgi:hypothetical protein